MSTEARALVDVVHDWEHISSAVYGYSPHGFALLVATDRRVLFVSRKLLSTELDDVPYSSVEGVSLDLSLFFATVTIHTKIGDFSIQAINFTSSTKFVDFIESTIDEHRQNRKEALA